MPGHSYGGYTGNVPRIASVLTPLDDDNLALVSQIGVTDVVSYDMGTMPSTGAELLAVRKRVESFGLRLAAVEGGPPMDLIVLGKKGRDEQIEHYKKCIIAMGEAGIPILCYNFMPWSFRVGRTSYSALGRGGSLTSEWRSKDFAEYEVLTEDGKTTDEQMWVALEYFLKAVVPTAEKAGVYLAMHPDDPPITPLRGLARILQTPAAFERMLKLYDSPHNGITFCQGCFSEMGVDLPSTIRKLGHRVHFVHFRDVIGTGHSFIETWQDEGQTDMHACMKAWADVGFNGIIRPDHVPLLPTLEKGHDTGYKAQGYFSGKASGYTMVGRLFAVGYIRGLLDAVFGRVRCSAALQNVKHDRAKL